jgi:hypothetical protein
MEKGTRMTVSGTSYVGAMIGNAGGTVTNNWYNGMTVVLRVGGSEYTGFGYGVNRSDANGLRSATGGYCGATNVNGGRNVEWSYDPWTKAFTVSGNGATAGYTSSMAPSIISNDIASLTIGEGVTGIGAKAFSGWTNLNQVTFDGCVFTSAADNAFEGCTSMAEGTVTVNSQNPFANIETNILSLVTNGTLRGDENLYLGVQQQGDSYYWQGGYFRYYNISRVHLEGVSFTDTKHWTTYYSPMNLVTPEGITAYVVDSFDDSGVEVTAVDYIPAGVGVLLYSSGTYDNISTDVYNGVTLNYSSLLEGSISDLTLAADAGYILYKDEFVLTKGGSLSAYRCYLPVDSRAYARGLAARLSLIRPDGNINATGIIEAREIQMDDGDNWYTVNGHKLSGKPIRKGVYIHNGRKVVTK